jgi:hypothetical protein
VLERRIESCHRAEAALVEAREAERAASLRIEEHLDALDSVKLRLPILHRRWLMAYVTDDQAEADAFRVEADAMRARIGVGLDAAQRKIDGIGVEIQTRRDALTVVDESDRAPLAVRFDRLRAAAANRAVPLRQRMDKARGVIDQEARNWKSRQELSQ